MSAGILCASQIKKLIRPEGGTVRLYTPSYHPFDESLVGASAIDLPLGDQYWEMRGSCRTGDRYKIADVIQKYSLHPGEAKSLGNDPAILKRRQVYLFKADCDLDLSGTRIQGKATGRSSIGRLDVLVRLLVDESNAFDSVDPDRRHGLYVEVTPISFDLEVKKGTTLSQLRLFKGREQDISLTLEELQHEEDDEYPVLDRNGAPYRDPCGDHRDDIWFPFRLNLDPDPSANCSAFAVKKDEDLPPIDPDRKGPDNKGHYDPHVYWEPIQAKNGTILLEPDRLYILRSEERLRIPAHLALECRSYTTQMGEWRIEYAGFAHPYFGRLREDHRGTPIIFEVRGHNVPTILTHGIPLGNVCFLRMSQPAEKPKETPRYEGQELALSGCFKAWS